MDFLEILKSLSTGLIVGLIFSWFNLPIPAPGVLSGVMGVIGIFLGYAAVKYFFK